MPLAAGFLWLVVLWLCLYQVIPDADGATGLAAEIYRIVGAFGAAALAAAVSFVAYLIGILAAPATAALTRWFLSLIPSLDKLSPSTLDEARRLAARTAVRAFEAGVGLDLIEDTRSAEYLDTDFSWLQIRADLELKRPQLLDQFHREMSDTLMRQLDADIPLVATRLLAENRETFDRYDRADAEAAFRFSIWLPLLVISGLVPFRAGWSWWGYALSIVMGLAVAALLIYDGNRKQVQARDAIYQAVFAQVGAKDVGVMFPSITNLEAEIKVAEERADATTAYFDTPPRSA